MAKLIPGWVCFTASVAPAYAVPQFFTDPTLSTPGLVGSYVNRSLETVTAADWRVTQTIAGTRLDTNFARALGDWGARAAVGVTGGTDADWENFSVQWDGWVRIDQSGQRLATASDDGSRWWIDLNGDGAFTENELFNNGWGRSQDLTMGERSGPMPMGTYRIRIQYYEMSGRNEFHLVWSSWVPRQFTPAPGNPRQTVRAVVLNFDPRVPSEGNRRLREVFGWSDPRVLAKQFIADIEFMTGGAVTVQIVEWRDLDEFPVFTDGFRYAPNQYVALRRSNTGWHDGGTDFYRLMRQQNMAALVNSNLVDEIWCFGDHFFNLFGEAWMAGPNSFFVNGPSYPDAGFDRAIAGYGFNYERGVGEMIHNLSHRAENHGQRAYGEWNLMTPVTAFDKFSANYLDSPGQTAGVGTCHVPANADGHYDYANVRVVQSTAFDWPNYPNLTGATTAVGRDAWAFGPAPDYHRDYLNFYFGMMPRNAGTVTDGRQANWFKYIWDFNSYKANTGLPYSQDAFASGATIRVAGGTNHEFTVRYYNQTGINMATLGNSNVEVLGPGNFKQVATIVRIGAEVATTSGTARTVTYTVGAPGGTWDESDSGSYRVFIRANEVRDTLGNYVPAGEVGRFQVTIADPAALDVRQMLTTGAASVANTTLDIGLIDQLFDGSVDTLVRTPSINPLVVTLSFTRAQSIHAMRAYFSYASGDPAVRWQVETANALADLNAKTNSWRLSVPPTGTTVERYSAVTLATPVAVRFARMTATKLGGDNYVHANEWQLIGPSIVDTAPPGASCGSTNVTRPGGTAHFINVTYTDATGLAVTSLRSGNLRVTGPNGFTNEPTFFAVNSYLSGTPRNATYWFIPPGDAWDSTDNSTYTIELLPGQVQDTLGNAAPAQTLGTFTVNLPPPVCRPAYDLAETNALDWLSGAEGATASTANDTARKLFGEASVRFDTDGGFDTWLRFPPAYGADWDLASASNLFFSIYAENDFPFQGNSPWLRLNCADGYFEYRYYENSDHADPLNGAIGAWREFIVPLRARDDVNNGWRRTVVGAPKLDHVTSLEFHADTWDYGFTLWFDRVGFDLPVRVIDAAMEVAAGASQLRLRFDDAVPGTLAVTDLKLTNMTTGTAVPATVMMLACTAGTNAALLTFPGLTGGRLSNGLYRLVLPANTAADPLRQTLAAEFAWIFRVLDGDSDGDNDGLPDTWERSFGLSATNAADALADADNDGQSNLNEYRSNTDPRDSSSRLAIDHVEKSGTTLEVTWQSVPSRNYRIRWSADLAAWSVLTDYGQSVIISGSTNSPLTRHTILNAGLDAHGFYRIEAVGP